MQNVFEPKFLVCVDCGEEFVFTSAAQDYFAERGYTEDPKRCKTCHTGYKKHQREKERNGAPHQRSSALHYSNH
jgi:hypothetical protein